MSTLDRPFTKHLMKDIKAKNPTASVLAEVYGERFKQDEKWGVQDHSPDKWHTILMEELGEACEAELEGDSDKWRAEMIQVAAVAVAAIECYDRNKRE